MATVASIKLEWNEYGETSFKSKGVENLTRIEKLDFLQDGIAVLTGNYNEILKQAEAE